MIVAPAPPQEFTTATVPLRCDYLRQASLFGERTYPLPKVLPDQKAVIVDGDNWQDNFKRGIVSGYSFFTVLHTIHFNSVLEGPFFGREIIKARSRGLT